MSKIITVLGGNGFIGSRCISKILNSVSESKVYAISRSGKLKYPGEKIDPKRFEVIKGDCLSPSSFEDIIKNSTGIIHSIGVLFTNDNQKYHLQNKETCLRVAQIANQANKGDKTNLVYVSAERGIPFPLSLKYHGYIDSKRECEKALLNSYPNINPIILRPGFVKSDSKKWTLPIYYSVNAAHLIEKNLINPINSNLGNTLQLPSNGIELETLAHFAAAGALGKLKPFEIYSNDYLNDKTNLDQIKLV
jgi:nucleoside-diphosphate-sugar epimerase